MTRGMSATRKGSCSWMGMLAAQQLVVRRIAMGKYLQLPGLYSEAKDLGSST